MPVVNMEFLQEGRRRSKLTHLSCLNLIFTEIINHSLCQQLPFDTLLLSPITNFSLPIEDSWVVWEKPITFLFGIVCTEYWKTAWWKWHWNMLLSYGGFLMLKKYSEYICYFGLPTEFHIITAVLVFVHFCPNYKVVHDIIIS